MSKSKLLEDVKDETTNELLKALLEVHDPSVSISQERKVSILAAKLDEMFKGRLHDNPAN